jgi:hypothetical protein
LPKLKKIQAPFLVWPSLKFIKNHKHFHSLGIANGKKKTQAPLDFFVKTHQQKSVPKF